MHETILSGVSLHVFISNNNYHNNLGMHSTSTEQSWRFSSKIANLKDLMKISHKKHLREKNWNEHFHKDISKVKA
jgi:hypothetical protein